MLFWLRNQGLEIVLIVMIAMIATRIIKKVARMWTGRIDNRHAESDNLVLSEDSKHLHALVQVVSYVAIALVYVLAVVQILLRFGVNLVALVAPATILGAAIGFGAQKIVQDFLAGFFIIAERQYGYGDMVTIDGGTTVSGTVEDVTLRVTKLRTIDGEVVTVPNGQIVGTTNQSRDWARSLIDVPVPASTDIGEAQEALQEVCHEIVDDRYIKDFLLDEPTVMGVESINLDETVIRILVRTLPGKQWEVSRRMRSVISRRMRTLSKAGAGEQSS
ncbi:MAG TPA: mechanosensitive ion channel family protein [Dietzia timorensis]|uniref:Mechanosensitive ion channel family protein n=2 Tax=Dietzia timorensis TaxID=499555 RepID=A0A921JZ79_9ACTN|nr:mechanosensitive ion channel family protein [Dietzia timorensis]HJE91924.1 mechanosensitive ion channel family protein [Dietzia timorensis]